jgi:hypothetical protein
LALCEQLPQKVPPGTSELAVVPLLPPACHTWVRSMLDQKATICLRIPTISLSELQSDQRLFYQKEAILQTPEFLFLCRSHKMSGGYPCEFPLTICFWF